MRDEILRLLQDRPFVPFRIHLTNGVVHLIRHPEQVMVRTSLMLIGTPASPAGGPAIVDYTSVSFVRVVQVEVLPATTPSGSNGAES
jgi:hypothetical protein